MKLNRFAALLSFVIVFPLLAVSAAWADTLELKNGTSIEGVVQKVEKGQVTIQLGLGLETKTFDILEIDRMSFDTPRLQVGTSRLPLEHFLTNMEAQEMLGHFQAVETSAAEVSRFIEQARKEWGDHKTIEPSEVAKWDATKERFTTPLVKYQEAINDLYFHVLGTVDQYNRLAKDADSLYVGVKGAFQVGSSLIPSKMEKLPLKKYVPSNWYDTIFYEGYDLGYRDAFDKYSKDPYAAPPRDLSQR
ncbi:MAG: hypothetical protein HY316_01675 [Acidobacteria bacterium]|nr:hypothetical protein [Acidobacteriota bacterium]